MGEVDDRVCCILRAGGGRERAERLMVHVGLFGGPTSQGIATTPDLIERRRRRPAR